MDLSGLRIGVPRKSICAETPYAQQTFDEALKTLSAAGATIVSDVKFRSEKEWDAWDASERKRPLDAEFKASISRWCRDLVENPNNITSVEDIIQFIKADPREEYPERNVERLIGSKESPGIDAPVSRKALEKMLRCCGDDGILGALEDYKLDALVFLNNRDRASIFAARAGLPIFALPLGFYPEGTRIKKSKWGDLVDVAPNVP
jgi:amidase